MSVDSVEGLELWSGPVTVQIGQRRQDGRCCVRMNMNWENSLEMVIRDCSFEPLEIDQGCVVHFPHVPDPVKVYSLGGRCSSDPNNTFIRLAPRHSRVRTVQGSQVQKLTVALINLNPILLHNRPSWVLRADGWTVDVRPVPDEIVYSPIVQSERYVITHHATIYCNDSPSCSVEAFTSFLELLYLFLSFCSGCWISGTFVLGQDEHGSSVLEEWGVGRVSPTGVGDGWLDIYHAEEMIAYFPMFVEANISPDVRAMLDHVVYWNTRANTNLVGPDGSLILLQATLERMSWHVLVQSRRMLSEKGFNDLTAADQLRLLLGICKIPLAVPPELEKLLAFTKAIGVDGPEVLTRIRNRLVHPPKLNVSNAVNTKTPYYQAYTLAKWYVEMCVLSITGFQGRYNSRTTLDRWHGKVENVPWTR